MTEARGEGNRIRKTIKPRLSHSLGSVLKFSKFPYLDYVGWLPKPRIKLSC